MDFTETASLLDKWSAQFQASQNRNEPDWMRELRENAASQASASGFPTRKTEAWKYTPLRMLEKQSPAINGGVSKDPVFVQPPSVDKAANIEIANGVLSGHLPPVGKGVSLVPLSDAFEKFGDRLKPILISTGYQGPAQVFSALNTAFLDQGLLVHVGENVDAGSLILRWASVAAGQSLIGHFRVIVMLEPGARLQLLEHFESGEETDNSLNVVMQAELAEGAALDHIRIQRESEHFVLLTSTSVNQAGGSQYLYHGFDLGGGLVRHELNSRLDGSGASAGFNGAFVLDGKRHVDNHVSVDHASPGCDSSQFFRGVLGGSSRGVFNGRALIRPGSDESSVYQSNANLLLSPMAEMDTKPELEIYADEVEASHGATVGQLDEAAIFYLRTRGLSEDQARRMLTAAFCHAVSDRVKDRELAGRIAEMLDSAMPGGVSVPKAGE